MGPQQARKLPTTAPLPPAVTVEPEGREWVAPVDGVQVRLRNLEKVFWPDEGYTKADLVGYYAAIAPWLLPYVRDRPLTLKRMPDGIDGEFFYEKRAPGHAPEWLQTAPVRSREDGKTIDYVLAGDTASLLWLANMGCIEIHPWHSRVQAIGQPDYAVFDLDPFGVDFDVVCDVALVVKAALDHLGLRSYARTSGATGLHVCVPLDPVHSFAAVRAFVRRVCASIHAVDPARTTMEWEVRRRHGKVFLDAGMNTEGKNLAATFSLRPLPRAPVATPLTWEEVAEGFEPGDFLLTTIWGRLERAGDPFAPVLEGGQDLRGAMEALGLDPEEVERPPTHEVLAAQPARELEPYRAKRDFGITPEPEPAAHPPRGGGTGVPSEGRFVIQHHLASTLHHDLRLEREGVAKSWAVPKGLPEHPGIRRLAVATEDHPLSYLEFEGDIPDGEYGAGPMRIWDAGSYRLVSWTEDAVTVRLQGRRHRGTYKLVRTDANRWLALRTDEPEPGEVPAEPPTLRPMLASTEPVALDDPAWWYEVKWDGVRVLATTRRPHGTEDGATTLGSRQGNDITDGYPELADLWERVLAHNAVLDGEIIATDEHGRPSFQQLQRRMHTRDVRKVAQLRERIPVVLIVFDLLAVDGCSLCDLPLSERLARLDAVLIPGDRVQRSEVWRGEGSAVYDAVRGLGLEGLVAKRATSAYRPGARSRDWRKIKLRHQGDVVIGGWLPTKGHAQGPLGALAVGAYDADGRLRFLGRVGSGIDERTRSRLEELLASRQRAEPPFVDPGAALPPARWVEPDLVCRVGYADRSDQHRLRAPTFEGLRFDVDARDCRLDDLPA